MRSGMRSFWITVARPLVVSFPAASLALNVRSSLTKSDFTVERAKSTRGVELFGLR